MEYFSVIYKILKAIEKSMDYDEFDFNSISPEIMGITRNRWEAIMLELARSGYISGVELIPIMGRSTPGTKVEKPILTIKGAEYLNENSMMKKACRMAKEIREFTR